VFFIPTTITALHALENHVHFVCHSKDNKHYHKRQGDDCNMFHFQISSTIINTPIDFKIRVFSNFSENTYYYYLSHNNNQYLYNSLRAPPFQLI
jgi:hypothetical protein